MSIPREFIEQLLTRIEVVDLIDAQVPLRKKSGSNYFARCPFHHEKSASFSVSQTKQFYHCFGCGAHGNAIDFLMQYEHLSFPEAVESLARQAGLEVPRTTGSSSASAKKDEAALPALFDLMTQAAAFYSQQLQSSQKAIQYLKHRGMTGEIAKLFHLGYAPAGWSQLLDQLGTTDTLKKQLQEIGLIIKKEDNPHHYYDRFRDRIMFPIHHYRGNLIGFGGRIIDQGEPKYLNSPETPLFQKGHTLYGLYQALKLNRQLNKVLVVEGYMDVVALFQHDITYAVAALGTATTSHHIHRLVRYTSEIIFCFDGDEAGRTAAWRALQVMLPLMQDHLQVRFLFLPEGEDPDTLVRSEGKEAFERRLSSALSLSAFFFQTLSRSCDFSTLEGRARFAASALSYMKHVPDTLLLSDLLLKDLSTRARVDIQELKQQLRKIATKTQPRPLPAAAILEHPTTASESKSTLSSHKGPLKRPMKMALAFLVQYPSLAHVMTETLPESRLVGHDFLQRLIGLIKEMIKQTPSINTGHLLEHWRDQHEESFIAKLACLKLNVPEAGITQEFLGTIRQLHLLTIQEEIDLLLAKAHQQELSEPEKQEVRQELTAWIIKKKGFLYKDP